MNLMLLTLMLEAGLMASENPESFVFTPHVFQAQEGCSWLGPDAGLRMNDHYIAGPGPGDRRDEWLERAKQYREKMRAGALARHIRMEYDGVRAWVRAAIPVAKLLKLQPGEKVLFTVSGRRVEGNSELCLAFDYTDAGTGAWKGWSGVLAPLPLPQDGEWHEMDVEVAVPADAPADLLVRPIVGMDATRNAAPGAVDIRTIMLGIEDVDRMTLLSRYLKTMVRPGIQRCLYQRADQQWAAATFTGHFTFLYDRGFYDPEKGYTVDAFLKDGQDAFGGYDTVILWHAYPRIGVDDRNQFDFYRDMPGGLAGLRGVVDQLHAAGVKAFIAYKPWDTGTRREGVSDEQALGMIVKAIDADGVYLDTLGEATPVLRQTLDNVRPGAILASELHPPAEQLSIINQSWAQWLTDPVPPGMLHLKWLEPRHMQQQIRRWDTGHQAEIETAFFNGSGMVVWENVFGAHNPWPAADRDLWRRAIPLLRAFAPEFTSDLWDPFFPTFGEELYAHHWPGGVTNLFTFYNLGEPIRHGRLIRWTLPENVPQNDMRIVDLWNRKPAIYDVNEFGAVQVWGDVDRLGCIAVSFGDDPRVDALMATALPGPDDTGPVRAARPVIEPTPVSVHPVAIAPEGMVAVPGGDVHMKITHPRRECGCYPDPGTPPEKEKDFLWGSPHDGQITHDYTAPVKPYYIDAAQVTNAQYAAFLNATGYQPKHPENFLKHWPDGKMPADLAGHPVVYVDLDDARAYAAWAGKRLPTEPEWQWAAQGDDGRAWPWGNDFDPARCNPGKGTLPVTSLPEGKSPFGCYHMSGNVWEWTESARDDGHTRFCILRGGGWFKPEGSGWYVQGGPQRCDHHAKFLLMWPGLDRCATIGFRCAADRAEG